MKRNYDELITKVNCIIDISNWYSNSWFNNLLNKKFKSNVMGEQMDIINIKSFKVKKWVIGKK